MNTRLHIPEALLAEEVLPVFIGMQRSAFECVFDPPIDEGQSIWLRLSVKPRRLIPPVPIRDPDKDHAGIPSYRQLLDILGAETMLQSFRDAIAGNLQTANFPPELAAKMEEPAIRDGLAQVQSYIFDGGFDAPMTLTSVEDHRIILVPRSCRVNIVRDEGCVTLQGIAPLSVDGYSALAYHWYAGRNDWEWLDSSTAVERLYAYADAYADVPATSKNKAYLTYATRTDHILGCEVIDELTRRDYFRSNDSEHYYLNRAKPFPPSGPTRRKLLADIVSSAAQMSKSLRPLFRQPSQFRILYEAVWGVMEPTKSIIRDCSLPDRLPRVQT